MFPEVLTFPRWGTNSTMLLFLGSILEPNRVQNYTCDYPDGTYTIGGFRVDLGINQVQISIDQDSIEPASFADFQALGQLLIEHIKSQQEAVIQAKTAHLPTTERVELVEHLRSLLRQGRPPLLGSFSWSENPVPSKTPLAAIPGNKVTAIVLPAWSVHRVMVREVSDIIETQVRMLPGRSKWVPIKLPRPNDPDDGGRYDTWQLDRSGIWQATFQDEEDTNGCIWIRGRQAGNSAMLELEQAILDQVQQDYGLTLGDNHKWQCKPSESAVKLSQAEVHPNGWVGELNLMREKAAEIYARCLPCN
jgi:hypothetical protein